MVAFRKAKHSTESSAAKSAAEPILLELVKTLEDRSYKTYKARLMTHRRLALRNNAWNCSLIAFATSTTVASVGILVQKNMYGTGGDALMVALAILSLVTSLVVSNMNYGSRGRAMEANYKSIQQISTALETLLASRPTDLRSSYQDITTRYMNAVDSSENHSEADYFRSIKPNLSFKQRRKVWFDTAVTVFPIFTLIAPVLVIIPFVAWFIRGL